MAFTPLLKVVLLGSVYDALAFHIVRHSDIETSHLHLAKPEYQQPSWFGPQFVALRDINNADSIHPVPKMTIAMDHPMYYMDLTEAKSKIQNLTLPITDLKKFNTEQQLKKVLTQYPTADAWLGLSGLQQDMVVLLNKEKAEAIKIVDLRPWN